MGESIIIRLPCGNWGVVDCYQRQSTPSEGTLAFLQRKGVDHLAFFCNTHPHEDHYLGADLLLKHYAGKIDQIWRHPGFTKKDITDRAVFAAQVAAARLGNPEPVEAANAHCKLLSAIESEKPTIKARDPLRFNFNYRRITGPTDLLEGEDYRIHAIAPSAEALDIAEARLAQLRADLGFSAFRDDTGDFLNSLSVILHINFGKADILLLADAQGAGDHAHHEVRRFTVVKIAHHGSENGVCASLLQAQPSDYKISHAILTPYNCSGLPDPVMVNGYRQVCQELSMTEKRALAPVIPGMPNAVPVDGPCEWVGLEVLPTGKVQRCRTTT